MSEIFPLEIRAQAIAVFFADRPVLRRDRPDLLRRPDRRRHDPSKLFIGYLIGAGVMAIGGIVEIFLGVDAEGKSLEDVAAPLSAVAQPPARHRLTPDALSSPQRGHRDLPVPPLLRVPGVPEGVQGRCRTGVLRQHRRPPVGDSVRVEVNAATKSPPDRAGAGRDFDRAATHVTFQERLRTSESVGGRNHVASDISGSRTPPLVQPLR